MHKGEKPHYRDVDLGRIVFLGIVSVIVLLDLVVATQAYFYNIAEEEVVRKDVNQPFEELETLLSKQRADLEGYRWVDRDKLTVAIPIEQAMKRYLERLANQPADAPQ